MVYDANDVGVRRRERIRDRRRSVARAVIDRDDLEDLGQGRKGLECLATRASRFASSLWAGKKYDSRGTRAAVTCGSDMRPIVRAERAANPEPGWLPSRGSTPSEALELTQRRVRRR